MPVYTWYTRHIPQLQEAIYIHMYTCYLRAYDEFVGGWQAAAAARRRGQCGNKFIIHPEN